jgi:hypothetical protein
MALKVIGSGRGRTGTMSLKLALEQLGFGPCHHMIEVIMGHPESVPLWIEAGKGRPDWDAIYRDYQATVDYPGAMYWRQLAAHFPDAKIVHTVRDPDKWFESTQATIFAERSPAMTVPDGVPLKEFFDILHGTLSGGIHDRKFMVEDFKRHTEEVVAAFPPERVLVYDVSQGWEPLCKFLGMPVPATPFPRENTREDFTARIASMSFGKKR